MKYLPKSSTTKSRFISRWHTDLEHQLETGNLREFDRRFYGWGIGRFLAWAEYQGVETINPETIQEWTHHLEESGCCGKKIGAWSTGVMNFIK